jgi:hypothetical protein
MRDAISNQIEGEINSDESDLRTRETEFRELQSTDTRAEKRQMWMQSISGQGATQVSNQANPTSLGARPDALGATGGRPLRGIMDGQLQAPQPQMGLGGMRTPMTSSKPLSPIAGSPLAKPVKAPIGGSIASNLPQPVQKLVRKPLQPISTPEPETQMEQVPEPISIPEPVSEPLPEEIASSDEEREEMTTTVTPITAVLESLESAEPVNTAVLTPQPPQLIPKKARGAPPQSKPGQVPSSTKSATLKPVQKLTPLKLTPSTPTKADEEDETHQDE